MLDLRKDLFSQLVISAQRNKSLNRPFRVVHFNSWDNYSPKGEPALATFEKISPDLLTDKSSMVSSNSKTLIEPITIDDLENTSSTVPKSVHRKLIKPLATEKIDEKVERIISDPKIAEIKMELEVAEGLLKKIKAVDAHNSKIPILEQTVFRMKQLLEQKSYI